MKPPKQNADSNYVSNQNGYYLPDKLLGKESFFKKFFKKQDLENDINERVRLLYVELTRAIDLGYFVVPKINDSIDEVKNLYDCNKQTDFINYYGTDIKLIDISSLLNEKENKEENKIEENNSLNLKFNVEETKGKL